MLTLDELTTGADALLRTVEADGQCPAPAECAGSRRPTGPVAVRPATGPREPQDEHAPVRVIEQVEACDDRWRPRKAAGRPRETLFVLPAADCRLPDGPQPALRTLARAGAVAVAVASPHGPGPAVPALAEAARRTGLPLLVPTRPCTAPELLGLLLQRLAEALRDSIEQRDRLLELSARLNRQGKGPGPLLHWLGAQTSSRVTVLPGRGGRGRADLPGTVLEKVAAGRMRSAALETGGHHVLLHPIGAEAPHRILAAVRETPWPRHHSALVAQAAGQVALLQHPLTLRTRERRLRRGETALRTSAWRHLMAGETTQAATALEPLLPELLDADVCQVYVVQCAPGEDRAALAAEIDAALGRRALVAAPAEEDHVIAVRAGTDDPEEAAEPLRPVVEARPHRAAGASRPVPWIRTAHAYRTALQALAAARDGGGDRVHVHAGTAPLAHRLPPPARAWAAGLLAPLLALPEPEREELIGAARLALDAEPPRPARPTGTRTHREAAARRLERVMELVGLDRTRPAHRAVLELALHLADPPTPVPAVTAPTLAELLDQDAAREYAAELLAPLRADQLGLLITWVEHDCRAQPCAEALGVHRDTVSSRLAEVAAVLDRRLGEHGNGSYDVLLALVIDGALPPGILPAASGRASPSTAPAPGTTHLGPPGTARIYNALLGGEDHYAGDRDMADQVMAVFPTAGTAARANRAFVQRSTRWLAAEAGIRQFLDIGTGVPASPNIHEIAQAVAPECRVVYVDHDPVVLAHAHALLGSTPEGRTAFVLADATDPGGILADSCLTVTLDLSRPVAVSLNALLHFIDDGQDPQGIVRRLMEPMAPGSYLVVTHGTDAFDTDIPRRVSRIYCRAGLPATYRDREQITRLFDGLELVEPGIVPPHRWRPEPGAELPADTDVLMYAGVGRKP